MTEKQDTTADPKFPWGGTQGNRGGTEGVHFVESGGLPSLRVDAQGHAFLAEPDRALLERIEAKLDKLLEEAVSGDGKP